MKTKAQASYSVTVPGAQMTPTMSASLGELPANIARRPIGDLCVSLVQPQATDAEVQSTHSHLLPSGVVTPKHNEDRTTNADNDTSAVGPTDTGDAASRAVLIHPKRINDEQRYVTLYMGLLLFIVSSMQGVQALFGVLLMEQVYRYSVLDMTNVYVCGAAFGMFVFPFGVLYDWFGPRIVVFIGTVLVAVANLLFALMFGGHITHSVRNAAIVYAVMSWGCYALDVAVLPAVLTHMPRDRGQPTGLLKTFSGLGASFLSCLYRGFFLGHFDRLMWLMFALTLVIGIPSLWLLKDAPYVVTRWQQRSLTPRDQLRCYLIRNRYMTQLVPNARFIILGGILVVLNIYLTIQAVCAAYLQDQMTTTKYRAIAIVAIIITASTFVIVVPMPFLDGAPEHDHHVIDAAKEKEKQLHALRRERREAQERVNGGNAAVVVAADNDEDDDDADPTHEPADDQPLIEVHVSDLDNAADTTDDTVADTSSTTSSASASSDTSSTATTTSTDDDASVGDDKSVGSQDEGPQVCMRARAPSTYNNPVIETLTLCGQVYVKPVYQTTFLESLTYIDIWLMFFTTMFVWGVGLTLTANWNIEVMLSARYLATDYKTYILFASMAGVTTAGGRVFLGTYEMLLKLLRERYNIVLAPTIGYPVASVGLFIAMVLWIALPGTKVLIMVYIIGPVFYGMSTSMTVYVLGTIFDRDIGMHYGFCFLGAAIGIVLCFRLAWFIPYDENAILIPFIGKRCVGQRKCMDRTVGAYIALVFATIFTSYFVHYRYNKLVHGTLTRRRVIVPVLRQMLQRSKGQPSPQDARSSVPSEPIANDAESVHAADAQLRRHSSSAPFGDGR